MRIFDLYDLSAVWTKMVSDIADANNAAILQKVKQALAAQPSHDANQIRRAVAQVPGLNRESWQFVFHDNVYVYHAEWKDQIVVNILIKICDGLLDALRSKKYDLAYDLADAVHCLPDIIAENHLSITDSYWESHIRPFRRKWEKGFLKNEQRALIKARRKDRGKALWRGMRFRML